MPLEKKKKPTAFISQSAAQGSPSYIWQSCPVSRETSSLRNRSHETRQGRATVGEFGTVWTIITGLRKSHPVLHLNASRPRFGCRTTRLSVIGQVYELPCWLNVTCKDHIVLWDDGSHVLQVFPYNAHTRADASVYTPIHSAAAADGPWLAQVTAFTQQLLGE